MKSWIIVKNPRESQKTIGQSFLEYLRKSQEILGKSNKFQKIFGSPRKFQEFFEKSQKTRRTYFEVVHKNQGDSPPPPYKEATNKKKSVDIQLTANLPVKERLI